MISLHPYANIAAGTCLFIVGFVGHWLGQFISVVNWGLAIRLGLQEKGLSAEYKVYEHAIAVADTSMAWLYGVVAVGLFLQAEWGYKLAWIPGFMLIYHAISAWVWEGNRRSLGHPLWSDAFRIGWCAANLITGVLVLFVAWSATSG